VSGKCRYCLRVRPEQKEKKIGVFRNIAEKEGGGSNQRERREEGGDGRQQALGVEMEC